MRFFCFGYNGVLVCRLSFRAGIYGTKTGVFSRKIKFVIFACSFASIAAALRRLSDCGLTQAVFLRNFWGYIIMGFGLPPEFSCLNLWHENGNVFAKDKFVIFACSSASIAGGLTALFSLVRKKIQKSTQRACEPSPLPGTP